MTATEAIKQIQTILSAQGNYAGAIDGLWGPQSREALSLTVIAARADSSRAEAPPAGFVVADDPQTIPNADARSEANIATLLPDVRRYARALVKAAKDRGITIVVISGTRTYAEQDALYEQGRSKPGPIVTNARGGYSSHNFSTAFDIGYFRDGKYIEESPIYEQMGDIGKSLGLSWGGDWTTQDLPHFYLKPDWAHGESEASMMAELRRRHESGTDVFG